MRKNIKFLRQNKPEKPEDALHEFSWNDYMEEDKQLDKQKKETWILQPWMKQKIISQSPQLIKSPKKYSESEKRISEHKKQSPLRPKTIEPKIKRGISIRMKTQCKPSLVSFQQLEGKRYETVSIKQRVPLNSIEQRNSIRKRSLDITVSDWERPISLIQYPVTMNIGKKKKLKYFGKLDKLLSQTKV